MSGSLATLKLYGGYEASSEGKKPLFDLVLQRKGNLCDTVADLGIQISVQDTHSNYRTKLLQLYVPTTVKSSNNKQMETGLLGQVAYQKWVKAFKLSNRPIFSPIGVKECYICEAQFSGFNRLVYCHKCGTAVCKACSNYWVRIPEYDYDYRVRTCRNCIEQIYKSRNSPNKLSQESDKSSSSSEQAQVPKSHFYQHARKNSASVFSKRPPNNFHNYNLDRKDEFDSADSEDVLAKHYQSLKCLNE